MTQQTYTWQMRQYDRRNGESAVRPVTVTGPAGLLPRTQREWPRDDPFRAQDPPHPP